VSLAQRSQEGLSLTAQGQRLAVHAAAVEARLQEAGRALRGEEEASGAARVSMPEVLASELIGPQLHRFSAQHPEVSLSLLTAHHRAPEDPQGVDVQVTLQRPRSEEWVGRRVGAVSFGLYAAEAYLQRYGFVPRPQHSLAGHRVLAYEEGGDHWPEMSWLHLRAQESQIALRTPSLRVLREALLWGVGLGVLPTFMASSALRQLVAPQHLPRRGVWLVVHRDRQHVASIQAAARFLGDTLGMLLDPGA
jgi:DNA-binding transcriptional LysR family regulator